MMETRELIVKTMPWCAVVLGEYESLWGALIESEKVGERENDQSIVFKRWENTFKYKNSIIIYLHAFSCINQSRCKWHWTKKGKNINKLRSRSKNRNIIDIILEWLSNQCCWVLILECQLLEMSQGSVHHQGALLTVCHLATQQVQSAPKWCHSTLPSSRSAC